ncbi:hypothetical protein QYM36_006000 [Artemia franciscana]|uniref:Uncharacterized protein n=1 Tax=Artemia franciscana TaxID=6661 RepID=A0AA88LEQ8_ARTSF|nr:hypothetical protein QYM36_006000 [Artemia franciscana]
MHLKYNVMSQCEITTKFNGFSTDPILLKAGFWVFLKSRHGGKLQSKRRRFVVRSITGGSRSLPYTSIYFKYWAVTTTYLDRALSISIKGIAVYKDSNICQKVLFVQVLANENHSQANQSYFETKKGEICGMLELIDFIYNLMDGEYLLGRGLIRCETRWVNPVVFAEEFAASIL